MIDKIIKKCHMKSKQLTRSGEMVSKENLSTRRSKQLNNLIIPIFNHPAFNHPALSASIGQPEFITFIPTILVVLKMKRGRHLSLLQTGNLYLNMHAHTP